MNKSQKREEDLYYNEASRKQAYNMTINKMALLDIQSAIDVKNEKLKSISPSHMMVVDRV